MADHNYFSDAELKLLFNKEIFDIKRSVTEKLYLLFYETVTVLKDTSVHKTFPFPAGTDFSTGKISKGENYKDSPYVILDFPKLFNTDAVFAFRTMFWFGHSFIFSFVASGDALKSFRQRFLQNRTHLHNHLIYFSTHKDAWQHEVNKMSSLLIDSISDETILNHMNKNNFIKLSATSIETNKEKIISEVVQYYTLMLKSLL